MNTRNRNTLGFWSIVLLGINGVIGSGIFLLPGKMMDLVGPGSLFVYIFMAMVVMAIALCFAECAGRFTRNGASYVYARAAFGEFVGFEVGLMSWAIRIIAWAAMAVGFVTALSAVWPAALREPIRTLLILAILLDLPLPRMSMFEVDYASLTEVRHAPPKTEIQLLNFTPWRDWHEK